MRGTISKYPIVLKRKQRKQLEGIVRRRKPSHWLVLRAKLILLSARYKRIPALTPQVRRFLWIAKSCVDGASRSSRVARKP